ncbi:MAG: zinc ribbon domain-containing protein [Candidatus Hermodarchaeota archaeon]
MEGIKEIVQNVRQMFMSNTIQIQSFIMELQKLMNAATNANKETLDYVLNDLKEFIDGLGPIGAAILSTALGAMVESGGDPMIAVKELLDKVEEIASLSMDFNNACFEAGVPESDNPHAIIDSVKKKKPLEAQAWDALGQIYPPVVAMLSKSKEARKLVKNYPELLRLIFALARNNKGAKWLADMFVVLDDEEILVFYPSLELGYRIITSGIANNGQLHLLLAGALIGDEKDGWIPGTPPDPTLVSYVRDVYYIGDARTEGFFEMRNWRALKPDGTLVQVFETYNNVRFDYYCIWGEGPLIEIPPFEGIRVIFLDPPATGKFQITRNFNARRIFPFMDAELKVIEKLSKETVREYFKQIIEKNEENKDKPFISKEQQDRDMSQMLFGVDEIKIPPKGQVQPKNATTVECSNCGTKNKAGAKFCGACGTKIIKD